MSINLVWEDLEGMDRIKIYRSTSKMSLNNLPVPMATIPGTEKGFLDVTANDGVIYYYIVSAERDGQEGLDREIISYNLRLSRTPRFTGHGPVSLKRGDVKVGYYGTLSDRELFTNQQLCNAFNTKHADNGHGAIALEPSAYSYSGTYNNTSGYMKGASWEITPQIWHKFIHNGKILFIPVNPVGGRAMAINTRTDSTSATRKGYYFNQVSHLDIIRAGAYGDEEDPLVIERDGVRYRVRLMRGLNDGVETFELTELNLKENGLLADHYKAIRDSELFRLYLPLFKNNAVIDGVKRLDNHDFPESVTDWVNGNHTLVRNYRNYRPDILQLQGKDTDGNYGLMFQGSNFHRHSQAASPASRPSVTSSDGGTVSSIMNNLSNPSSNIYGYMWHPVLELITD